MCYLILRVDRAAARHADALDLFVVDAIAAFRETAADVTVSCCSSDGAADRVNESLYTLVRDNGTQRSFLEEVVGVGEPRALLLDATEARMIVIAGASARALFASGFTAFSTDFQP